MFVARIFVLFFLSEENSMKTFEKSIIVVGISSLLIVMAGPVALADEVQPPTSRPSNLKKEQQLHIDKQQLHQDLASPLGGAMSPTNSLTQGWQKDVGGISGNTNGMNGYPTASGQPSNYPGNKY